MTKFKPGDKVRIVSQRNLYDDERFAPGTIHTVISCDDWYCRVNPEQPHNGYQLHMFKLVELFNDEPKIVKKKDIGKGWGF